MQRSNPRTMNMNPIKPYQANRTYGLFHTICKIIYWCCGTNFWFEDMDYPAKFMKIYNAISRVLEVTIAVFLVCDWGAFWTQPNLTEKQSNDRMLFAFSHVVIYSVYISVLYYKGELRELVKMLAVRLKEACNDELIEKMMLKSTFRYLTALVLVCSSTLFSCGIESGSAALTSNATFTTIIPVWPDVEERSLIAGVARIVHYVIWWIFVVRVVSVYFIVLTSTIGLAHQFMNLCKYFEDLNDIFKGSGSQEEKERRYETAFKVGIKMHSITLWCARQTQRTCGLAFSGQVIINICVLVLVMIQMMFTERTLVAVIPLISFALSVLVGSAVFLWNAGDVTIEATRLPHAMFHSGWHNCTRQSVRVRKLITTAIAQAQKQVLIKGFGFIELSYEFYVSATRLPHAMFHSGWHNCTRQSVRVRKLITTAIAQAQKQVLIKGFGFIELSYEFYVSIVKSSYSLFSVIY